MKTKPTTTPNPLWKRVVAFWRTCRAGGEAEPTGATVVEHVPEDDGYIFGDPDAKPTGPKPKGKPKPKSKSEEEESAEGGQDSDDDDDDEEDLEEEASEDADDDSTEEDDADDADDEEADDEEDEDEEEEDEDEDDDEPRLSSKARRLQEDWANRLDRMTREGDDSIVPPQLQIGLKDVTLRPEAFKRFKEALEKDGDDAEAQAAAAFEVAIDAVAQTLGIYDQHRFTRGVDRVEKLTTKKEFVAHRRAFKKTPLGKAAFGSKKTKAVMGDLFENVERRFGWRAAMMIPFEDYAEMAGVAMPKGKGKGAKKKLSKKARDKARALGAAAAPRGSRSVSSGSGRKKSAPAPDSDEAFVEYLKDSSTDLFEVE